jgi:hypothetical protein
MRSCILSLSLVGSLFLGGCSSAPPAPSAEAAAGTSLTVVGWSLRDQAPLPVRGVIRAEGAPEIPFDTKSAPAGKTFTNIAPGRYRVEVSQRYAGDKLVPVSGIERADVKPGESVRCEVVVDDRESDGSTPPMEGSR